MQIDATDASIQIGKLRCQPRVEFDHRELVGARVVEKLHVEQAVSEADRAQEAPRDIGGPIDHRHGQSAGIVESHEGLSARVHRDIDDTLAIARQFGATVTQRPFDNWAAHQNWGLENVPFKHPWVFYIDADERMTPELVQAVQAAVVSAKDEVAFRLQRRDYFLETWLKHVQTSSFYMRLFRPEKMRYERLVNPISIADGPVGQS